MQTTSKTPDPDLKFVARSAAEVSKRARRLMENLALPDPPASARSRPEPVSDAAPGGRAQAALTGNSA